MADVDKRLLTFSLSAIETIDAFGGQPIYLGGDDLLFFAPVMGYIGDKNASVFELVKTLSASFDSAFSDEEYNQKMDIRPTLSFGVSITYYKYPMFEALDKAWHLLKDVAKEVAGKNALAFQVLKHSGQEFGTAYAKKGKVFNIHITTLLDRAPDDDDAFLTSVQHVLTNQQELLCVLFKDATDARTRLTNFFANNFNEPVHSRKETFLLTVADLLFDAYAETKDGWKLLRWPTLRCVLFSFYINPTSTTMTKRYLIKLYPTGPFFFGGENTFGAGFRRNYLAKSEDLPQQTTLLGMLRFQLLAQNGQIPITNKKTAEELIGPASFQVDGNADFGLINDLSPVFLMKGETAYRLNPVDDAISLKADKPDSEKKNLHRMPLTPETATVAGRAYMSGRLLNKIPDLPGFDHKTHYQERFINGIDEQTFEKDKVLCAVEQVGIQKSRDGQTLNNAFFKQTLLRFPTLDWSFAFYADLGTEYEDSQKNKKPLNFAGGFVTLGGEQSLFNMEIKTVPGELTDAPVDAYRTLFGLTLPGGKRIELLSDAYVSDDLYEHCQLAYTDTISFRGIKTTVQDTRHYHNQPQKTERLELLKRGSVLWSTDPGKTTALLKNATFQTIGYNAFYNGPLTATALTQPDA